MKIGLVGRTNVGKSTIFNRLIGSYRAIVSQTHGTTRELLSEEMEINDGQFATVFDSPGLDNFKEEIKFINEIINLSDIILFVIDGKEGLNAKDEEIKNLILKSGKKDRTFVLANKLEGRTFGHIGQTLVAGFYELGFENVIPFSGKHGENFDILLAQINILSKNLGLDFDPKKEENFIPIAVVGRPNVGKSTFLNKVVGEEISQVSEIPGTTLDYLIGNFNYKGKKFKIYDTAGIRKKGKIHGLERMAFEKTLKMLEFIKPIVIFIVDAIEGITHRDMSLFGEINKLNIPIIMAVNKIDEIPRHVFEKNFKLIQNQFDFVKRLPIVPISAKEGISIPKLMDFVLDVHKNNNLRINTSQLNKVLNSARIQTPPRFPKNKVCKFYYASQVQINPMKFLFFINSKAKANFSFERWLENVIRKNFGFVGIPISLDFKEKERDNTNKE